MNQNSDYPNQAPVIINPPAQQHGHQGTPTGGYSFSAEELRVLKECNIESFYQRSAPIGILLGTGTFFAIQKGILKPSLNYGATPKVMIASILGYFIGKFSYQSRCAEKIMRLPNSKLAEALRRRKGGEFFERINPDGGLSLAPFSPSSSTDIYTDENLKEVPSNRTNSLDLDLDRPINSGLDDFFRPSIDTPDRNFDDNLPQTPKVTTTYEELRRKNREEYERKMQNPYYRPINPEESPAIRRAAPQPQDQPSQTGPRNKYGDVILK